MKAQVAVQMYTIRDFTKTAADLATSLKKVSDMGFTAVQMSAVGCMGGGNPEVDAARGRALAGLLEQKGVRSLADHLLLVFVKLGRPKVGEGLDDAAVRVSAFRCHGSS